MGESRVTLELVIDQYEQGLTPEDIVRAYDTLVLAEVYAAIAYYLQHRHAVRTYFSQQREAAAELRTTIESGHPSKASLITRGRIR